MPDENVWLDTVIQNIARLDHRHKRAIACHALFQAAISKRPYNLFHRRNLYMRLANVERTFGNKATWDKPFDAHFRQFIAKTQACVFRAAPCRAVRGDAAEVTGEFDLVYIDPPYLNAKGVGVDYHGFYHFLEGLADYPNWAARIDYASRHRRLAPVRSDWMHRSTITDAFTRLFERYRRSILAVSYRNDGIPSLEELTCLLCQCKPKVAVHSLDRPYAYALSTNATSREVLLIGTGG